MPFWPKANRHATLSPSTTCLATRGSAAMRSAISRAGTAIHLSQFAIGESENAPASQKESPRDGVYRQETKVAGLTAELTRFVRARIFITAEVTFRNGGPVL